jgi:2-polyprenyl-3-methyl-5-hydroxy-6-metoxy-1,4-benzoquinol methylase
MIMAFERLSADDETMYVGYANHMQRYHFADQYCAGQSVLDAGCGTGYGSAHLAISGAARVVGVDIADEAIAEAKRLYARDNLRFLKGDVEQLSKIPDLHPPFDVAVNLENIEHLKNPTRFLAELRQVLKSGGTLVVSSPNGDLTERDHEGRIKNPYHIREFTEDELRQMLGQFFTSIELYGQWRTPEMLARIAKEKQLFELLCELYYSPFARIWRSFRKLIGKKCAPPPAYSGDWGCFARDWLIRPLAEPLLLPWPPDVILAVCR